MNKSPQYNQQSNCPHSVHILDFLKKKKKILRKSSKPGHGNLLLITSTVQVELSKLSFNFDDIRTYFLSKNNFRHA